MSSSYYQIVKPFGGFEDTVHRLRERDFNPAEFKINDNIDYIILKISPSNIDKFENLIQDLNINYLLLTNIDFEKIITFIFENKVKIREILINDSSDETNEEIYQFILNRKYDLLLEFINSNKIVIKSIELIFEGNILRIYDSGIIWSGSDISVSTSFINFIKSLLNLLN